MQASLAIPGRDKGLKSIATLPLSEQSNQVAPKVSSEAHLIEARNDKVGEAHENSDEQELVESCGKCLSSFSSGPLDAVDLREPVFVISLKTYEIDPPILFEMLWHKHTSIWLGSLRRLAYTTNLYDFRLPLA